MTYSGNWKWNHMSAKCSLTDLFLSEAPVIKKYVVFYVPSKKHTKKFKFLNIYYKLTKHLKAVDFIPILP